MTKHEDDDPSKALEELRTLLKVQTSNQRNIVEHKIPGKETSSLQDMGRHALRLGFLGEFMGKGANAATESLWQKFQKGKTVPFSSDLVGLSEVTQVMIERLDFEEMAGDSGRYRYRLQLREYAEPKKDDEAPSQQDEAKKNTENETDKAEDSVNYVTGKVLDKEKKPVEGAKVHVKGDQGEYQVQTDENGIYRKDNLDPGKYTVTVDAPGYENQKQQVEIKGDQKEKSSPASGEEPGTETGSQSSPSSAEGPGGGSAPGSSPGSAEQPEAGGTQASGPSPGDQPGTSAGDSPGAEAAE